MQTCVVIGAGSTFADRNKHYSYLQPPLDKNFFWNNRMDFDFKKKSLGYNQFVQYTLKKYFKENFNYDIVTKNSSYNSLEFVLKILFTDVYINEFSNESENLLFNLISLLNSRISNSTKHIHINNHTNLVRVLKRVIDDISNSNNLSIISFNYDLHIENCLDFIASNSKYSEYRFHFPGSYYLEQEDYKITTPTGSTEVFSINANSDGIKLYKPHGSLNWFKIIDNNKNIVKYLAKPKKTIYLSKRKNMLPDLRYKGRNIFPVIVPPLINKGAFIKNSILDKIWRNLSNDILRAERIIFYGYSLPETDLETLNVFSRCIINSKTLNEIIVINPDFSVCNRIMNSTGFKKLYYYRSSKDFLNN